MLSHLSDRQLQVLYNATATSSQDDLMRVLNNTIMRPRIYEEPLMEFQEYRARKIMLLYIPPILILLGTFGNVFSFIVLRRKPMIKVSSYMYLAVLAVVDTVVLYNGLLRIWIVELLGFDYQESGHWVCKLTVTFGYVTSDLSVWLIIAVTVERYIVVCFPFQASSMCNVSRARKVIVFLFLLMLALNVHFFWTTEIVEEQEFRICRGSKEFRHLVEEIWPWVDTLVYSLLPFVTITVLNVLIIREVAVARSKRVRLAGSDHDSVTASTVNINATCGASNRKTGSSDGTHLTALLLTVSFTFLILTLPNNVALIVSRFWNQKYENNTDHITHEEMRAIMHGMARFKLVMAITELLMYTNHSINFFLYCATGNKFRQQILDLFRCLKPHRQTQTQIDNFSHSMRKTSHSILPVGPNDMMLVKRVAPRKSSSFSSDDVGDAEKNEHSFLEVGGSLHAGVNGKVEGKYSAATHNMEVIDCGNKVNCRDVFSYQNGDRYSRGDNNTRNPVKDLKIVAKTSLKKCSQSARKESAQPEKDKCFVMNSHIVGDHNCKSVLSNTVPCKVQQSKKKHKQLLATKRGSFGQSCDESCQDNEYILLQPTIRWCGSEIKS